MGTSGSTGGGLLAPWSRLPLIAAFACAFLSLLPVLRAADAASRQEPPVELPPLIVSDQTDARPWRYVEAPGIQVLSRCDDDITEEFVLRSLRLTELVEQFLPPTLQFETDVPRVTLLVESAAASSLSQNLVVTFGARDRPSPGGQKTAPTTGTSSFDPTLPPPNARRAVQLLPNLQLGDVDEQLVFAIIDAHTFEGEGMDFSPDHIRIALERRTPALPRWFINGVMRCYAHMHFGDDHVTIDPLVWRSADDTRRLRDDPDAERRLLAPTDFFALEPDTRTAPEVLTTWDSQGELFFRWSLVDPQRRSALWRFVAALADGRDPEASLQTCFGIGFADLRDRLSDYLPVAIAREITLKPDKLRRLPRLHPAYATPGQIGRLKGEWERLEYGYVKARYPDYASRYLVLAKETIARARDSAPADPGLLAVAGLLSCDLDDFTAARGLLEAAAVGPRARPRVYTELARLRLADMAASDNGRISTAQGSVILQTLAEADAQNPPLEQSAALKAEVWARTETESSLDSSELDLLHTALRRFPRSLPLLYYGALTEAQRSIPAALALLERGERLSPTPAGKARFQELHQRLLHVETGSR